MQNTLIDKGILLPSGEIGKDKINLIAGAITQPFMEMLWTVTNGETETTDRIFSVLSGLFDNGREAEMMEVLRLLYGVLGLPFPEDVELLAGHTEARSYFLFSFLLDYDDIIQDYMAEQSDRN
ncbi:hypothetical protein [Clostridium sp. DJ247]|uniref:hypothetical protein n=1 Tax=Clostridium sp. DJ247 TaxID=2726188 RepID=UPI0016265069|nr:hypothetical protein [Clostridium sp. DJ247]MBC2581306.1 hypothetical protein [Clostridium sp. DJ247]